MDGGVKVCELGVVIGLGVVLFVVVVRGCVQ
jgi:hypothetical protein